jgi:hypothetical protein
MSRIWEFVAANKIEVGDILAWRVNADSEVPDYTDRVTVTDVLEHPGGEVLPYVLLCVAGPTVAFERLSGVTTGRTYRQGDAVCRMKPAHARRVGANLRTVVKPAGFTSQERLEAARAGVFPAGMEPGDL